MELALIPFLGIGLVIFFSSFFTVKQQTAVVIERFGNLQALEVLVYN
jgi:regulator of protease activity HflC (stomatin/prohibitin superfamily)